MEKDSKERKKESDLKKRLKSTGSKRVMIVARVDDVPESYHNLKVVLNSLNLSEVHKDFRIVCDLKVMDILLGIQGCSALHPCPYCDGYKLSKKGYITNQKGLWVKGSSRTMNNLLDSNQRWNIETKSNRKLLKNYSNVEFPPIYVRAGQENVEVWSIFPPPQLHVGILGPANDVFHEIDKRVDITSFKKKYFIKGFGPGGEIQGDILKNIMNNDSKLNELESNITKCDPNMNLFTEHLRHLAKLNAVANSKELDIDLAKSVLLQLRSNYFKLVNQFDLSQTVKMHIVCDHYEDYFELTGESLLSVSDEITESVHSRYRLFEETHGYLCNKKGTPGHVKKQQKSIVHFNSLNLGDM